MSTKNMLVFSGIVTKVWEPQSENAPINGVIEGCDEWNGRTNYTKVIFSTWKKDTPIQEGKAYEMVGGFTLRDYQKQDGTWVNDAPEYVVNKITEIPTDGIKVRTFEKSGNTQNSAPAEQSTEETVDISDLDSIPF